MKELNHPNVVSTRPVPPIVRHSNRGETVLSMEYCSGGDLRGVLEDPANCCGLPSGAVLHVLRDLSSAVEYLHSQRIIHRDLKPDNIVLQPNHGVRPRRLLDDPYYNMTFKLIDLGYAKKLGFGSMTASFVGTVKYIAPEILESESEYSFTADFWSLGTLAFEIMVGRRPFFPDIGPASWYNKICEKTPEQICSRDDFDAESNQLCNDLPRPTQLNEPLRERLIPWLRSMLRFDRDVRGGYVKHPGRSDCFHMLDRIVQRTPLVQVFSVATMSTLTYSLDDFRRSTAQLQTRLERDTGLRTGEQDILTGLGECVDLTLPLDLTKLSHTNCWLFVLPRSTLNPNFNLEGLPSMAKDLWAHPSLLRPHLNLRQVFGQVIFVCNGLGLALQRLVQTHKVSLLHLLRLNVEMEKKYQSLVSSITRLTHFAEFVSLGANVQLNQLQSVRNVPPDLAADVNAIFHALRRQREETAAWKTVAEGSTLGPVERRMRSLQGRVVELLRSPLCEYPLVDREMETLIKRTHALYTAVKEKDDKELDHGSEMKEVMGECFQRFDKFIDSFVRQWSPLLQCRADIREFLRSVENVQNKTTAQLRSAEESFVRQHTAAWKMVESQFSADRSSWQSGAMTSSRESAGASRGDLSHYSITATMQSMARLDLLVAQCEQSQSMEDLESEHSDRMKEFSGFKF